MADGEDLCVKEKLAQWRNKVDSIKNFQEDKDNEEKCSRAMKLQALCVHHCPAMLLLLWWGGTEGEG